MAGLLHSKNGFFGKPKPRKPLISQVEWERHLQATGALAQRLKCEHDWAETINIPYGYKCRKCGCEKDDYRYCK